jgi:hypothetical protein
MSSENSFGSNIESTVSARSYRNSHNWLDVAHYNEGAGRKQSFYAAFSKYIT